MDTNLTVSSFSTPLIPFVMLKIHDLRGKDNYEEWADDMECLLVDHSLGKIVAGERKSTIRDDAIAAEVEEYDRSAQKAVLMTRDQSSPWRSPYRKGNVGHCEEAVQKPG